MTFREAAVSAIIVDVSSRVRWLGLPIFAAGLSLQLSCRQPAAAPKGATPEVVANRAAPTERFDRLQRPDRPFGPRAGGAVDSKPQPRPLRRCFAEDTAQSPPRSLSVLLAQSADRFEQGLLLASQAASAPGTQGSTTPAAAAASAPAGASSKAGAASEAAAPAGTGSAATSPASGKGTEASTKQFEAALACAQEALRLDGRSIEALHNQALALQELGQLDLARDAFTHALAIDPDDPETLAGAADLYINRLAPSPELSEIGVEYAHRGSQRLQRSLGVSADKAAEPSRDHLRERPHDLGAGAGASAGAGKDRNKSKGKDPAERALLSRLLLLEAQGLNDLGRPREALARLDTAIVASDSVQARYERALALLDLCRLPEARRQFLEVVQREPGDAWAHYSLGLTLEMLGAAELADKELSTATQLAPHDFPPLLPVSPAQFRALVDKEVAALTAEQRQDLQKVSLETADLPALDDLTAEDPPLSPTILGLFRGLPLGESAAAEGGGASCQRATAKTAPGTSAAAMTGARPAINAATNTEIDPSADNEPRAIVLYRKNLLRAVRDQAELVEQIRTTLLHELGHLRGEDDAELRARGLE